MRIEVPQVNVTTGVVKKSTNPLFELQSTLLGHSSGASDASNLHKRHGSWSHDAPLWSLVSSAAGSQARARLH